MRLFGAILILTASLGAGSIYIKTKKCRMEALRDLIAALEQIQGELKARNTPLPELWEKMAERAQGTAKTFFERLSLAMDRLGTVDFAFLWKETVDNCLRPLNTGELDELVCMGDILGRYALEEQINALAQCCSSLRKSLVKAQNSYPGERRLGLGLSASAGLLLIIALF